MLIPWKYLIISKPSCVCSSFSGGVLTILFQLLIWLGRFWCYDPLPGTERDSDHLTVFQLLQSNSLSCLANLLFALYLTCIILRSSIAVVEGKFTVRKEDCGEGCDTWNNLILCFVIKPYCLSGHSLREIKRNAFSWTKGKIGIWGR